MEQNRDPGLKPAEKCPKCGKWPCTCSPEGCGCRFSDELLIQEMAPDCVLHNPAARPPGDPDGPETQEAAHGLGMAQTLGQMLSGGRWEQICLMMAGRPPQVQFRPQDPDPEADRAAIHDAMDGLCALGDLLRAGVELAWSELDSMARRIGTSEAVLDRGAREAEVPILHGFATLAATVEAAVARVAALDEDIQSIQAAETRLVAAEEAADGALAALSTRIATLAMRVGKLEGKGPCHGEVPEEVPFHG